MAGARSNQLYMNKLKSGTLLITVAAFLSVAYFSACKKETVSGNQVANRQASVSSQIGYPDFMNLRVVLGARTSTGCDNRIWSVCRAVRIYGTVIPTEPVSGILVGSCKQASESSDLVFYFKKNLVPAAEYEALFSTGVWSVKSSFEFSFTNESGEVEYDDYKVGADEYGITENSTDYIVRFHH